MEVRMNEGRQDEADNVSIKRFLRIATVMERTGLAQATIYEMMHKGTFPKNFRLTPRACGWLETDVDAWIDERVAERHARNP